MFDIGWGELVVIAVVALVVIGPKELPTVLRTIGEWMTKIRRMASEFQGQFHEAMREAELADLKKQVDSMTDFTSGLSTNPLESARRDIESAFDDKPAAPAVAANTEPPASAFADGAVTAPSVAEAPAAAASEPAPAEGSAPPPASPDLGGGRAA
jgi:sec-independent protein translocase protein TatB